MESGGASISAVRIDAESHAVEYTGEKGMRRETRVPVRESTLVDFWMVLMQNCERAAGSIGQLPHTRS